MIFGEASVLNDGRRVVAPWQKRGVYIGERFLDGPVMLCPDAALDSQGRVWVTGHDAQTDAVHVTVEGAGTWWTLPVKAYGRRGILRADGDACQVACSTTAYTWATYRVNASGAIALVANGAIPTGEGAQGMRGWDAAGKALPMAPLDEVLAGRRVRARVTVGDVSIAGALFDPPQVVMGKGGALGTLALGDIDWPTPRISANGKYWVGARYAGEVMLGGELPATIPPLRVDVDIPAIGRPLWAGFMNFMPADTPGTCRWNKSDGIVRSPLGGAVALFVEGDPDGSLAAINAAISSAKSLRLPIIAYWPRALQTGPLPTGFDILGVEAYCGKDETLAAFEARVRTAVKRAPRVALVCQCYTSNALLTTNLAALVPVYARIARDCPNVWGVLVFSGYGRATGLEDHPELLPLWTQFMAGIPSAPAIEEPMEPWKVNGATFKYDPAIVGGKAFTARAEVGNGIEFVFEKDASDSIHIAVYKEGVLQDRSGLARHVEVKG